MEPDYPANSRLQVSNLGCLRGGRVLFRNRHIDLHGGTVLTLRGSNGSGKSTLLRTLAGLLPMRAGELRWCGRTLLPTAAPYQSQLAYLSHHPAMNDALTGIENLHYLLTLAGMPWQVERVREVLGALGVLQAAGLAFGKCSQGQRRRLGLARVLLSDRQLWLLDEPDSALDDQGLQWLAGALTAHAARAGMAIVATHRDIPSLSGPVLDLSATADAVATAAPNGEHGGPSC